MSDTDDIELVGEQIIPGPPRADKADLQIPASAIISTGVVGGILIQLVNYCVSNPNLQQLLMSTVPLASILITSFGRWGLNLAKKSWENGEVDRERNRTLKRINKELQSAKEQLDRLKRDPHTDEKSMKRARAVYEELHIRALSMRERAIDRLGEKP